MKNLVCNIFFNSQSKNTFSYSKNVDLSIAQGKYFGFAYHYNYKDKFGKVKLQVLDYMIQVKQTNSFHQMWIEKYFYLSRNTFNLIKKSVKFYCLDLLATSFSSHKCIYLTLDGMESNLSQMEFEWIWMEFQSNCQVRGFCNKYLSQFIFFQPCLTWKLGKQGSEGFCIRNLLSLQLPSLLVPLVICREIIPDVEYPAEVKQKVRLQNM